MGDPEIESGGSTAVGEYDPDEIGAKILAKAREKHPRYVAVSDERLAAAIGAKIPRYEPYLRKYAPQAAAPAVERPIPTIGPTSTAERFEMAGSESPLEDKIGLLPKAKAAADVVLRPIRETLGRGEEALAKRAETADPRAKYTVYPLGRAVMSMAEGLATPEQVLILAGSMGAGGSRALQQGLSAFFATDMGKNAIESVPAAWDQYKNGEPGNALKTLYQGVLSGAFAAHIGAGAVGATVEPKPPALEKLEAWNAPEPPAPTEAQVKMEAAKKANATSALAAIEKQRAAQRQPPGQAAFPEPPKPGLESLELPEESPIDRMTLEGFIPEPPPEPPPPPPAAPPAPLPKPPPPPPRPYYGPDPNPNGIALLKQAEAQKGFVDIEDVPEEMAAQIYAESKMQSVLDELKESFVSGRLIGKKAAVRDSEGYIDHWEGGKSILPKELQSRLTHVKIVNALEKAFGRKTLGWAENKFVSDLFAYYYRRGKQKYLDEDLLEQFASNHGLDITTRRMADAMRPEPEETFDVAEMEGELQRDRAQAQKEAAAAARKALGPESEVVKAMEDDSLAQAALVEQMGALEQPKEHVAPNPRAHPMLNDELTAELGMRGVNTEDPQAVADFLGKHEGISKPIKVTETTEPVSQSLEHPDHYEAQLSPGKAIDKTVHEVSGHIKDRELEKKPPNLEELNKAVETARRRLRGLEDRVSSTPEKIEAAERDLREKLHAYKEALSQPRQLTAVEQAEFKLKLLQDRARQLQKSRRKRGGGLNDYELADLRTAQHELDRARKGERIKAEKEPERPQTEAARRLSEEMMRKKQPPPPSEEQLRAEMIKMIPPPQQGPKQPPEPRPQARPWDKEAVEAGATRLRELRDGEELHEADGTRWRVEIKGNTRLLRQLDEEGNPTNNTLRAGGKGSDVKTVNKAFQIAAQDAGNWKPEYEPPEVPSTEGPGPSYGTDYAPGEPWYYKEGGRIIPAEEIPPATQAAAGLEGSPKKIKGESAQAFLKRQLDFAQEKLDATIARYNDIAKHGDESTVISDYDKSMGYGKDTNLALGFNHIRYQKRVVEDLKFKVAPPPAKTIEELLAEKDAEGGELAEPTPPYGGRAEHAPARPLKTAVTGEPFAEELFHGKGHTAGQPYGELSAQAPILGKGFYATPSQKFAASFGEVSRHKVEIENPLVIDSDTQWRALTKEAGWEFPNPYGVPPEQQARMIEDMRELIEQKGHDGVIVRLSDEVNSKTLEKVFGEDTAVSFEAEQGPYGATLDLGDRQVGLPHGGLERMEEPPPAKGLFREAAYRDTETGEVHPTGAVHDLGKLHEQGIDTDQLALEEGFVTHEGDFATRAEASEKLPSGRTAEAEEMGESGELGPPPSREPPGQAAWEAEHPPEPPPAKPEGKTPEGPGANDALVGELLRKITGGPTGSFSRRAITVNEDLQRIADTLETLTERQVEILAEKLPIIEQRSSMGREAREEFREEGITTPEQTFALRISPADAANITARMTLAMREAEKLAVDIKNFGDPIAKGTAQAMLKNVDTYMKQYKTLGTTWARIGHRLQMPPELIDYVRQTGRLASNLREVKLRRPIYTNIAESIRNWKELDPGHKAQVWYDIVDAFRLNLFSVSSFSLDMISNLSEIGGQVIAGAADDLFVQNRNGQFFPNLRGFAQALDHRLRWKPMHPAIQEAMGHTVGGEILPGFASKGFGTFTRRGLPEEGGVSPMQKWIEERGGTYKPSPLEGNKLLPMGSKIMDYGPGIPLYAKGTMDRAAGNFAAMATLYAEANKFTPKGLSAMQRKMFRENFISDPGKALGDEALGQKLMELAIRRGNEAKFNRELSMWQEKWAANPVVRLLGDMFGRWGFQFARWAGEMVGVDPRAWKRIGGTGGRPIDHAELARFLAKAATGLGGLAMLNALQDEQGQSWYDRVDFKSMEFVKKDGDRVRLIGREPFTTAFTALALFRAVTGGGEKDWEKLRLGLPKSSIPFGKFMDFSGGLISSIVNVPYWSDTNRKLDPRGWKRDMIAWVNSAIPGQALLSAMESLIDPGVREGVLGKIPGLSEWAEPVASQTTGQELRPEQSVLGSPNFRTVGGVPIPGATRKLDPVHKLLMRYGTPVYRGPRQPLVGQPPSEVPDKLRREWEKELGYARLFVLGPLEHRLRSSGYEVGQLDFQVMRKLVMKMDSIAAKIATNKINLKYGAKIKPERQPSMRELVGPTAVLKELQEAQKKVAEEKAQAARVE